MMKLSTTILTVFYAMTSPLFAGSDKPEEKPAAPVTAAVPAKDPKAAQHGIKGLVVSCVDYRLAFDDLPNFAKQAGLMEQADLITVPGGSLGAVLAHDGHSGAMGDKTREEMEASFDTTFNFLKKVHHFKEVYVLDHRDCGMYKAIYDGKDGREAFHERGKGEKTQHGQNMLLFKKKIEEHNKANPDEPLTVRFFLMDIVKFGQPIKYQEIKFTGDTLDSMIVLDNAPLVDPKKVAPTKKAAKH